MWTRPADLRKAALKVWERGKFLAALVSGEELFPYEIRLKKPKSSELDARFAEVQDWIQSLRATGHRLTWRTLNHRVIGKNEIPHRLYLDSLEEVATLVGRTRELSRFRGILEETRRRAPELLDWLARRSMKALSLAKDWSRILDVVTWLRQHPRPGVYLRQVDFPGVHTKVVEQHRKVLDELLQLALPQEVVDPSAESFEDRFGFRSRAVRVRFRLLRPEPGIPFTDLTVPLKEFYELAPRRVFITENEVNYLCFPPVEDAFVIFGSGYKVSGLGAVEWLRSRPIFYWGDIDTHGFAILNQLRAALPQTRSFLMDRDTFLAHRDHWVREVKPVSRELPELTGEERALYRDLVVGTYGEGLRLEQELVRYPCLERVLEEISSL